MHHETIADIIDTYTLTGTISVYVAICNERQILSEKKIYKGKIEDIPANILKMEPMEYELEGNKFLV
jgi:hypothetical protein